MFRVIQDDQAPTYGPSYRVEGGAVGVHGSSPYRHRFGGSSWRVVDPDAIDGGPTLLLTVDLADPLLGGFLAGRLDEVPLCSYLTRDVWVEPQLYRVDPASRELWLLRRGEPATEAIIPELAGPLEGSPIALEAMSGADRPESEEAYVDATDRFAGGDRPFRVLGPPLWLDAPVRVECDCGRTMDYFAALACEWPGGPGSEPRSRHFFGEGVLYWWTCPNCLLIAVTSQST